MNLLDLLFPKYCINCRKLGSYLCPNCFSYISFNQNSLCLVCNRASFDGKTHPVCKSRYSIDGSVSALDYKGVVKKLIYQFKYKPYLSDLKSVLVDLMYESLIQNELFNKILNEKPILVPIPLHSSRLNQRGYNHAEILAKELGKRFDLPVVNLLKRTKKTRSQFGLKRDERKENLSGAFSFYCHPELSESSGSGSHTGEKEMPKQVRHDMGVIFLIDDILTTGSTLVEAAKVLKKSGVKQVWGITLARD